MDNAFYQKVLMEHFKNPKNKLEIEDPDFSSGKDNPSCGDKISISGKITDGVVTSIGFQGSGCVVSVATASMLMEKCIGKSVQEILSLTKDDILKMIGLELGPNRLRCALLPLEALHKGILQYTNDEKAGDG